jgi:hypothetical protein
MPLNRILVGNYEIFDSGTLLIPENKSIRFELSSNCILIFSILEDSTKSENHHESRIIDSITTEYIIANVNAPIGRGFTSLWRFSKLNDRDVYFDYRITFEKGSELSPLLNYSFYLGEVI